MCLQIVQFRLTFVLHLRIIVLLQYYNGLPQILVILKMIQIHIQTHFLLQRKLFLNLYQFYLQINILLSSGLVLGVVELSSRR